MKSTDTPRPLIGRLAPSPTGAQHIGNARTFLLAWLSIRSRGGRLILRMEDIDSPRVKAGAERQVLLDLQWLGLDWDEGPDVSGPHAPYVQSQRLTFYHDALARLRAAERVYPCTCTRTDVIAAASAPHAAQETPRYPGTCSWRISQAAESLGNQMFSWRFRTSNAPRKFQDRFAGPICRDLRQELGDFVVARADRSPAYQLAVVIDDHLMGITEVVRGDDLLPSASRQLDLYDFFEWQPPEFVHVPLVVGADGRRLAKRHGDTRLATLQAQRVPAERLIGLLAWSCGLRSSSDPCRASDLLADFSFDRIPKTPFIFQEDLKRQLET